MKRISPLFLAGELAVILLGGFGLIADVVVEGDTMTVDMAVLLALRTPGHPADPIGPAWLPEAARDITALGSFSVLGIFTIVVVLLLLLTARMRTAWFLAAWVIGEIDLDIVAHVKIQVAVAIDVAPATTGGPVRVVQTARLGGHVHEAPPASAVGFVVVEDAPPQ